MNCTLNCQQGRACNCSVARVKSSTPKFHTQDGGAVVDTQFDELANSEEPDLPYLPEWVPAVLLAVVCVALYASWVYWR